VEFTKDLAKDVGTKAGESRIIPRYCIGSSEKEEKSKNAA
jgi:hypothetical protein